MKVLPFLLATTGSAVNPINRVAGLMQKLYDQVESDSKAADNAYDKFVCWCEKVEQAKNEFITKSEQRNQVLNKYLDDLTSGRVELTDERATDEKEQAELQQSKQDLNANRKEQKQTYADASADTDATIKAVNTAIDTMKKGMNKPGLVSVGAALSRVVMVSKSLSEADAMELRRASDVPDKDWKKLNAKATFGEKYEARSGKIFKLLEQIKSTFDQNKVDLDKQEKEDESNYNTLLGDLNKKLKDVEKRLADRVEETGARGKSEQETRDEIKENEDNIRADKGFIDQTQKTCATKKSDHSMRQDARAGEMAAIAEAIKILRNDDARDLFSKSYASHEATSFLQLGRCTPKKKMQKAVSLIRSTAVSTHSTRLTGLASSLALAAEVAPKFFATEHADIITKIGKMIDDLKAEYNTDLVRKEDCEETQKNLAVDAKEAARNMDKNNAAIQTSLEEISLMEEQNRLDRESIENLKAELAKAAEIRKEENLAWVQTDKDDDEAAKTVMKAYNVLQDKYTELAFTQWDINEGEAPPPPPSAEQEGAYTGQQEAGKGVLSILQVIHQDIKKDQTKAKAEEDASQKAFDEFEQDNIKARGALKTAIDGRDVKIGEEGDNIVKQKKQRKGSSDALDAANADWDANAPGCNFFAIHFEMRTGNRQMEIDGLQKAKAILEGAVFDAPDPNREMTVGDAFLDNDDC